MNPYLSKSRFAIALDCPAKLYYHSKPDQYANASLQNAFLQALAEGGFQVGALARAYYPDGIMIDEADIIMAAQKTDMLLALEDVTIFEGAFIYKNFCIRADIIRKHGNNIELIEVKAKSTDDKEQFIGARGYLRSEWKKYMYDVAFQKYVLTRAKQHYNVSSYLMLVNKSQTATVDRLNQKFVLQQANGRTKVVTKGAMNNEFLGEPILVKKNVDDIIERIYQGTDHPASQHASFETAIHEWADKYAKKEKMVNHLSSSCVSCEFKADESQKQRGMLSGFEECWKDLAGFNDNDFDKPSVLKIWSYPKKDEAIQQGRYFQEQFCADDFLPKNGKKISDSGWSKAERQLIQVTKAKLKDDKHELDADVLKEHLRSWKFPLHMIDFETTAVAIPFNKGLRPYEQVAFQFSHHTIDADGTVTHKGQWINTTPGRFPNFEFIRALKNELCHDDGTIFRYAAHENTVLNVIKKQLENSQEVDADELVTFIKSITHSSNDNTDQWHGERDMVDLLEVVKKCYYHPQTEGSNSLKYVLPAVVSCSDYLQKKYSSPHYGVTMTSMNFKRHQWLRRDENGHVINPYKTLPQIHEGIDNELLDDLQFSDAREIADGGAAMTAYARMQFTEMSDAERKRITDALLRYCELDTLAMVMLYEAWREWCGVSITA